LDSVLDYPLYFKIQDVFARAKASPAEIERRYEALSVNYDPPAQSRLVTFLDNHDQPRFLSAARASNRVDRLKQALVFLYTSRGVPCLYYGTEQAFNGGNDPNDREDMFAGAFKDSGDAGKDSFNMTHPLFRLVATLNNFRRLYPALRTGTHVNLWSETNGPGLLAYARRLGTNEVLMALNTAEEARTLPALPLLSPPGTRLVNLFDTNEIVIVTADGRIPSLTISGVGAKILVAQGAWQPLDPTVVATSPEHDTQDAPTNQSVVINFSEPMDPDIVQREFYTEPPVAGKFEWSPARDRMTFTPLSPGFPPGTLFYARLTFGARAADGRRFHAPFEFRFRTANAP
jgi:hypothetical protein